MFAKAGIVSAFHAVLIPHEIYMDGEWSTRRAIPGQSEIVI
jgi:hypothetical protein